MKHFPITAFLLFASFGFENTPGHSFVLNDLLFDPADFPVSYWVDITDSSSEDGIDEIQRIQAAFGRWTDLPSSTFDAEYRGEKAGVVSSDGENHLMWGDLGSGPFAPLGRAYSHGINGRRTDADIVFTLGLGRRFLSYVALHEIGHLIGFDHSDHRHAVMWATADYSKLELHWDDIEGITQAYPVDELSDLVPVALVAPRYLSPNDSVRLLGFTFQNVGLPVEATTTVEMYLSDSPEFDQSSSFFLGERDIRIEGNNLYEVGRGGGFGTGSITGSEGYFFLRVDTNHTIFESDEDNNLAAFPAPVVPFEFNGDGDLNGRVGPNDLFLFQQLWQRRDLFWFEPRFDFDNNSRLVSDDLYEFVERWGRTTEPAKDTHE